MVVKLEEDKSYPHYSDAAIIRIIAASGQDFEFMNAFPNYADNCHGAVTRSPFSNTTASEGACPVVMAIIPLFQDGRS